MIYDRIDDINPLSLPPESNIPCIHSIIGDVNKELKFRIDISNVKYVTNVAHNYGDNDDNDENDTVPNQVDSNNNTINLDKYNTISPIKHDAKKNIHFEKLVKTVIMISVVMTIIPYHSLLGNL